MPRPPVSRKNDMARPAGMVVVGANILRNTSRPVASAFAASGGMKRSAVAGGAVAAWRGVRENIAYLSNTQGKALRQCQKRKKIGSIARMIRGSSRWSRFLRPRDARSRAEKNRDFRLSAGGGGEAVGCGVWGDGGRERIIPPDLPAVPRSRRGDPYRAEPACRCQFAPCRSRSPRPWRGGWRAAPEYRRS